MAERGGPHAYVPMLRNLADALEHDERDRPTPPPTENQPHDVLIAALDLGWTPGAYRWFVRSDCGVVKVWSSRDGCMTALNPEAARRLGQQFAAAMDAAAEATDRASRGEPRMPKASVEVVDV